MYSLRGPGRKHGTPVSRWSQQLVSRIVVAGHAPSREGEVEWGGCDQPGPVDLEGARFEVIRAI